MQDMMESDHRKDSLQANQPILCRDLRGGWNKKTHFIVNSNVADKIKSYICTAQSIVQVTHSHNPFFLRRILFNYSCLSNK